MIARGLVLALACLNQSATAFIVNSNSKVPATSSLATKDSQESNDLIRCNDDSSSSSPVEFSRRMMFSNFKTGVAILSSAMFVGELARPGSAGAFDNKISDKYDDRPKRKGPKPKDLGVGTRKDMVGEEYAGLKSCGPAPNCFCSTDTSIEDDPEHNIPAWKWPSDRFGTDRAKAFDDLLDAVNAYKPGQGNIDGGGFKVISFDAEKGYLYAQFESLKNGYIDDLEFAWIDGFGDRVVQVRSSSRVGYLDFAVNAKRLNYIAKVLKERGWDAPGVDYATHQDYVAQNSGSR